MSAEMILPPAFYARPTLIVARGLLGCRLVREWQGGLLSGTIVETEAYIGEQDLACHARAGRTPRTQAMYGPAGRAYVYLIYGRYWLFNVVTEAEGFPAAVLIRSLLVEPGFSGVSAARNPTSAAPRLDGPGKLSLAFGLDSHHHGVDLTTRQAGLWLEAGTPWPEQRVTKGPRVGLYSVPEPWKSAPFRFCAH